MGIKQEPVYLVLQEANWGIGYSLPAIKGMIGRLLRQ